MSKDEWSAAITRSNELAERPRANPAGPWRSAYTIVKNGSYGFTYPGEAAFAVVPRGLAEFQRRRPVGFAATEEEAMLIAEEKYKASQSLVTDFFKKEPMPKKGRF